MPIDRTDRHVWPVSLDKKLPCPRGGASFAFKDVVATLKNFKLSVVKLSQTVLCFNMEGGYLCSRILKSNSDAPAPTYTCTHARFVIDLNYLGLRVIS